jgi:hypothetical protein
MTQAEGIAHHEDLTSQRRFLACHLDGPDRPRGDLEQGEPTLGIDGDPRR